VADQWRVHKEHRQEAEATLRYIREEVMVNRDAVNKERPYHEKLSQEIGRFLESDGPKTRQAFDATEHFTGVHPVTFERTAWDLALANQSLSYLKPSLAYAISRVYSRQQAFQTLENSFLQSTFAATTFATQDATDLANAILFYLGDVNSQEPALLQIYEQLLRQLDSSSQT
jgi:hypothetical protein